MKVKVLTIINKLHIGGIEKTFLSSVNDFQSFGYECHVLCNKGGLLENDFKEKDVGVFYFGIFKYPFIDAIKMLYVVIKNKYHIVHIRDGFTSGFFVLACRLLNVPIVVSIHSSETQFKKHWIINYFLNKLRNSYLSFHRMVINKFSTRVIGHSINNLNYYKRYIENKSKYRVVYNGVDFNKIEYSKNQWSKKNNNDYIQLIHVGSFKNQKNHHSLILIFKNLIEKGYKLKLILCGDGDKKQNIIKLVKTLHLNDLVEFKGNIKNPEKYILDSDIFVFPSLNEGFGNVLIEAQYCNVAICASDIPAHYESVSKIYHDYFFPSEDVDLASRKVEQLITKINNNEIDPLLKVAHEFAKEFSIKKMVTNINSIYLEILKK